MSKTVALYRKYRSRSLDEIVGQQHITDVLRAAIEQKRINHAYLFTGPHGVGKTSVARILAHAVNELPYTEETHLDIVEIDAASNRRIDEIRDLREKVHIAPTGSAYKVYIIDEVHMLTKEAFNALLKTLEEPPEHAIFILATTEVHKLPATIISRTQHYAFRPVDQTVLSKHIKAVADKEKIDIDDKACMLIAASGGGSVRDTLSLLGQLQSNGSAITAESVKGALGISDATSLQTLLAAKTGREMLTTLDSIYAVGVTPQSLASQLIDSLQESILKNGTNEEELATARKLIDVQAARNPKQLLAITLLETLDTAHQQHAITPAHIPKEHATPVAPIASTPAKEKPSASNDEKPKQQTHAPKVPAAPQKPMQETQPAEQQAATNTDGLYDVAQKDWLDILETAKESNNSLYAVLRMAKATRNETSLVLTFKFPFHKNKAADAKNSLIIATAVKEVLKVKLEIIFASDENITVNAVSVAPKPLNAQPTTTSILDLMGGGEVVAMED